MANLLVIKGPNPGSSIALEGDKIVLGRNADCGIVLNLPAVSREHALIRCIHGKFYIEDLKSRNGTKVNNTEIGGRTALQNNDRIRICDSEFTFVEATRPPLPESMRRLVEPDVEEEESSSTVEATITSHSSKQLLDTQPAEKLAFLLSVTSELTQTFNLRELLPKVAESLFNVFKQADRCFVIFTDEADDKRLIPEVVRTRHQADASAERYSRRIVNRCLETQQAFLSEDATTDKRIDLSQSIADCRIRSVMCVPLLLRSAPGKAFGVIQLDTQARHKKFNQEDLKLLMAVASQASIALENARMHETIVARASLERDLDTAREVQKSFLPKYPPQVPGYEFFAHYEAAQEVGGDYYDFIPLPSGRYAVMAGDVAGKGVPAALLMAKVSSDARFSMLTRTSPGEAVYHLNEQMQEAGLIDRFVTLIACLVDPAAHTVTFVNAGHLPPLLYRRTAGRIEEATSRELAGFPLGIADGIPYEAATVALEPGDFVTLFTDGVSEAKNRGGKDFEIKGAIQALEAGPTYTPREAGGRIVTGVHQHSQGAKQHDDITVVCFGRTV